MTGTEVDGQSLVCALVVLSLIDFLVGFVLISSLVRLSSAERSLKQQRRLLELVALTLNRLSSDPSSDAKYAEALQSWRRAATSLEGEADLFRLGRGG